jgi:hypothetical protein
VTGPADRLAVVTLLAVLCLNGDPLHGRLVAVALAAVALLPGLVALHRHVRDAVEHAALSWLLLGLLTSSIIGIWLILAAACLPVLDRGRGLSGRPGAGWHSGPG